MFDSYSGNRCRNHHLPQDYPMPSNKRLTCKCGFQMETQTSFRWPPGTLVLGQYPPALVTTIQEPSIWQMKIILVLLESTILIQTSSSHPCLPCLVHFISRTPQLKGFCLHCLLSPLPSDLPGYCVPYPSAPSWPGSFSEVCGCNELSFQWQASPAIE